MSSPIEVRLAVVTGGLGLKSPVLRKYSYAKILAEPTLALLSMYIEKDDQGNVNMYANKILTDGNAPENIKAKVKKVVKNK